MNNLYFYPRPPGGGRHYLPCYITSFKLFLSTPSGWRATYEVLCKLAAFLFLSTPSGWRATPQPPVNMLTNCISIHALRVEGDYETYALWKLHLRISIHALRVEGDEDSENERIRYLKFLSTPSGWRATCFPAPLGKCTSLFLSTPSGWRATTEKKAQHSMLYISIHALRVEGDGKIKFWMRQRHNFYPRPPGGGRRQRCAGHCVSIKAFLSTPSGWRATLERHDLTHARRISIHALRVEGDAQVFTVAFFPDRFLSTPSGWRATKRDSICERGHAISIHALRVEGDQLFNGGTFGGWDFYPRPPGGGRQ